MQLPLNLEPDPPVSAPQPSIPTRESIIPGPQPLIPIPQSPARSPQPLAPSPRPLVPTFVFIRHPRARRYIIRIADGGQVRVTVPRWGSKREAAAFAEREHAWIEKQLRARAEREQRERERQTTSGEEHREVDRRALIVRARRELPPRLLELASRHGLIVSRISIRNQRSRWGSCSRAGHICLNWRLVTMPDDVRDYVLIHELMHLRRMDHSPKFWKLVAEACPGYKKARAWLRSQGAR
jgi:predicted metal-dependent hydrolase